METKENYEASIGVRLIHDKKISSCQSTKLEPSVLINTALHSSQKLTKREFWQSLPVGKKIASLQKTNDPKLWSINTLDAADIAQQMINSANHQKILRISGSLNIVCEDYEIQNTNQLNLTEKTTYISGVINTESEHTSGIGQANARTLTDFDAESIGLEAQQMCLHSEDQQNCEAGMTTIVFDPMAVGEILSFVFTPNFSLKTYSEKRSCFSEKIGTKIATDEFSLLDEPHMSNGFGTKSFDDEGSPTQNTYYIRRGVFENTYSNCYDAFKEHTISSGNAVRLGSPHGRNAVPIPAAAPHNLTIKSGKTSRDEIIKDTKNGILVSRLWYTYPVNPTKGDFSCTARSGIWIIKNGQMYPARPVRIIHSLPELLKNIIFVSNNQRTVLSWAALPVTTPTISCGRIPITPIQ
jgi:PmbA protein